MKWCALLATVMFFTSDEVDFRIWFGQERTIVELSLQPVSCVMLESESIVWRYVSSYLPRSSFYIEVGTIV